MSESQKTTAPERADAASARKAFPALYFSLFPRLRDLCVERGWALLLHGSVARDMDLLAVPWTEGAAPEDDVVAAVMGEVGAILAQHRSGPAAPKPHGRRAYTLVLTGGAFIDLSMMPRAAK